MASLRPRAHCSQAARPGCPARVPGPVGTVGRGHAQAPRSLLTPFGGGRPGTGRAFCPCCCCLCPSSSCSPAHVPHAAISAFVLGTNQHRMLAGTSGQQQDEAASATTTKRRELLGGNKTFEGFAPGSSCCRPLPTATPCLLHVLEWEQCHLWQMEMPGHRELVISGDHSFLPRHAGGPGGSVIIMYGKEPGAGSRPGPSR